MHLWVQDLAQLRQLTQLEARIGRRCGSKILAPSDGISQNSPKADLRQTANTLSYLTDGPESRIMAGTEISAFFRVGLRSVWWNKIVEVAHSGVCATPSPGNGGRRTGPRLKGAAHTSRTSPSWPSSRAWWVLR